MRKTIAAAAVAGSIAAAGLVGSVIGAPVLAGAAETASGAAGWVEEALGGLVDDGTITREQADAVSAALEEARPERGFAHHRFGMHLDLEVVAGTLGMTAEELRDAHEDGDATIAEIAAGRDVDVRTVVDAIVAAHREHLDELIAAGELTRAEADEMLSRAEEHVTAFVNGERPSFRGGPHGRFAVERVRESVSGAGI